MRDKSLLAPLFKTLDKVIFGIDDTEETESTADFIELDNEEEFDVKRSIN